MSSASFVYFRWCNQVLRKSVILSAFNNALKNYSQSQPFVTATSRVNQNEFERISKFRRCEGLWSTHNTRQNFNHNNTKFPYYLMFIPAAVKQFFGYEEEEQESPEAVLITTIKRSILAIKRGEKDKAEQMLHIALKMAQDQRSADGVTYIYDVMANLAFDNDEFKKAEKLFVHLLQRLLANGMDQNDNKFLHINLKLAKVHQFSKGPEQCDLGYKYCLDALEKKMKTEKEDEDTVMLWCLALDWYGRFLLEQGKDKEALSYLNRAHDTLLDFAGETHPQLILVLNDLGIANLMTNDEATAEKCFEKALKLGTESNDPLVPNILVNMGLLYLKKLKLDEANKWCTEGRKAAVKLEDSASEAEASDCLAAIKNAMKTAKP